MNSFSFSGELSPRSNRLVRLLFVLLFFLHFANEKLGILPRHLTYIPEILAFAALFIFVLHLALNRQFLLDPIYLGLIGLFILTIVVGMVLNGTSLVFAIAGLRFYLRHLPFFLLPSVWAFSEKNVLSQLRLLLYLMLIQCPIAIIQRLYYLGKFQTGDVVTGTFTVSSELSLAMISTIAVAFAFYTRKILPLKYLLALSLCLLIPTTINETKATLIFLPLAFTVPLFTSPPPHFGARKKNLMTVTVLITIFMALFVPTYNILYGQEYGGLFNFLVNKKYLKSYLYRERTERELKKGMYVPRGDALVFAFKKTSEDPVTFLFGFGAGNVIRSSFRQEESTVYTELYGAQHLLVTNLLWELGLSGLTIYCLFMFLIFKDSLYLQKRYTLWGCFALGWGTVTTIYFISIIYKNMLAWPLTHYIFWYFSGIIASAAYREKISLNAL